MNYNRRIIFNSSSDNSYSLDFGDLDGNGSIDIVVANAGEPNEVFLNFDNGVSWKQIHLREEGLFTYDIILTDLNNDNRLDIVERNSDDINYCYRNRCDSGIFEQDALKELTNYKEGKLNREGERIRAELSKYFKLPVVTEYILRLNQM